MKKSELKKIVKEVLNEEKNVYPVIYQMYTKLEQIIRDLSLVNKQYNETKNMNDSPWIPTHQKILVRTIDSLKTVGNTLKDQHNKKLKK